MNTIEQGGSFSIADVGDLFGKTPIIYSSPEKLIALHHPNGHSVLLEAVNHICHEKAITEGKEGETTAELIFYLDPDEDDGHLKFSLNGQVYDGTLYELLVKLGLSSEDAALFLIASALNRAVHTYQAVQHMDEESVVEKKGENKKGLQRWKKWINRKYPNVKQPASDHSFRQMNRTVFRDIEDGENEKACIRIEEKLAMVETWPEAHTVSHAEKVLLRSLADIWEAATGKPVGINRAYNVATFSGPSPAMRFVLECYRRLGLEMAHPNWELQVTDRLKAVLDWRRKQAGES